MLALTRCLVTVCLHIAIENYFTPNGKTSWMKSSFVHMSMEWSLYVGTLLRDNSFLASSCIQQTIQKSMSMQSFLFMYWRSYGDRVIIANIRNLRGCPCPRCLIPKAELQNVATENDILQCGLLPSCDTVERREKISAACRLIYEEQYIVDTPQVETLLKPESLVPTIVCVSGCN